MTLAQLSYLVALDTHRHFRKAAAHCRVAQPSLSAQIRKLEEELGVVLFDRDKKPLAPTPIGEQVIAQARIVLAETEDIRNLVQSATGELAGTLRVGILPTLAPYLLPLILARFPARYPHITLAFEEVRRESMMELIRRDALDAGLLATPIASRGLIEQILFEEPLLGYVSEGHRLAAQPTLALADLSLDEMWLLSEGSSLREQVVGLYSAHVSATHASPASKAAQFESASLETLKRLVEQGEDMTVVPWLAVQGRVSHQPALVKPFVAPAPVRTVRMAYPRALLKKHLVSALTSEIVDAVMPLLPENHRTSLIQRC